MKKNFSLRTKLTLILTIAFVVVISIVIIVSNIAINGLFEKYILQRQSDTIAKTVDTISKQYYKEYNEWDVNYLHALSKQALENGYIIKVIDDKERVVWDTEHQNEKGCHNMMSGVAGRMSKVNSNSSGDYVVDTFVLDDDNNVVFATVEVKHYAPYFLMEDDFDYLSTLNFVFIILGVIVCIFAILLASYLAWQISNPIKNSIASTKKIAEGNYDIHLTDSSQTKELVDLSNSINILSETLSAQKSLRNQLTADVAHELRTPLTTLSTHTEMLMLGVWEPTTKRLEDIYNETDRLSIMVKDLESLSKSDKNSLVLEKQIIALEEIIDQCMTALDDYAKNKNITMNFHSKHLNANVDSNRIYQVFYNLLLNAIKYSHDGGHIEIGLNADFQNENAIISFKDNGMGISEKEIPFIFERFYRSEKSRNRNTGGSGIGLAIAKSLVEAHNGNISVKSDGKSYSIFTVTLKI